MPPPVQPVRPVFVNLYGRSDWLARVRDLAARADAIVYHVYSSTPGLERERVLIREYGAKCVVYVRNGFQSGPRMAALSGAAVLRVYEMPETVHTRAVSGSGDFDEELSDLLDGSGQTRIGKLSRRRLASDVQAVMNAGA